MGDKQSLQLFVYYTFIFIVAVFFQLLFELIVGDGIDAGFLLWTVFWSAIVTVLIFVFDRWRKRRKMVSSSPIASSHLDDTRHANQTERNPGSPN
jgi:hypothetical protein